jgi:hypothetical protein
MFKKKSTQTRRRRATSGSSGAPSVFSYHASRANSPTNLGRGKNPEKESAAKLRRPKFLWLKRTSHVVIVLAIGALFISNLLLASTPKIVVIGDEGKNQHFLRDKSTYQAAAQRIFASSVFNTNKLTIDVARIKKALTTQFPELADVSVSLPLVGRQPVIYLQPSTSRLVLSSQGASYVLDGTGKAIAGGEQAASLKNLGLPEVQDQSGLVVKLGSVAMPSTSVAFITEVARQLKAKDVAIGAMVLPLGTNELHVQVKDTPYTVKFNLQGDAREEAGAFLATKAQLDAEKKMPGQYIDVRVQNRVYYR